jgi:hypothetical protein
LNAQHAGPASTEALLQPMQDLLAGIYDLPTEYRVHDFLFTERDRLPAALRANRTDEQVLVLEQAGDAAVGLYLDPALLERLRAANPLEALHGGNLADYWTALEGVSHFLCLAWHAGHDRAVSLLELELQAEIDKYVTSCWLLRRQCPEAQPAGLHRLLFERTRIDPALASGRAGLYREANQYAARFCRRLERELAHAQRRVRAETLAGLRRFYRLNRQRKLEHIDRMA